MDSKKRQGNFLVPVVLEACEPIDPEMTLLWLVQGNWNQSITFITEHLHFMPLLPDSYPLSSLLSPHSDFKFYAHVFTSLATDLSFSSSPPFLVSY